MLSAWIKGLLFESPGSECEFFHHSGTISRENTDDSNHSSDQMHLTPCNRVDIKQKVSVKPAHTVYMNNALAGFITWGIHIVSSQTFFIMKSSAHDGA